MYTAAASPNTKEHPVVQAKGRRPPMMVPQPGINTASKNEVIRGGLLLKKEERLTRGIKHKPKVVCKIPLPWGRGHTQEDVCA